MHTTSFLSTTRAMGAIVWALLALNPGSAFAGSLSATVAARAASSTTPVEVLVEFAIPVTPESLLGDEEAALEQRLAIADAGAALLRELGDAASFDVLRTYETIPWIALRVDPATLGALERSPLVGRVVENKRTRRRLGRSVRRIRGKQPIARGADGAGWAVAVIDSGVDAAHPFLAGRVVAEACFVSSETCPNGTNRQTGPGAAAPCTSDPDECSHGTHVAGIAAGRGDAFTGVAPGASILAANVESEMGGETGQADADIIAALEWVYGLRRRFRIASVNLSLGGGRYTSVAECDAAHPAAKAIVDNLRSAGILTIAAAGNDGFTDALEEPACISSVVSVGATTRSDRVADYSASATFLDLLAPGGDYPDGIESSTIPATGLVFEKQDGTSQATPHVAGAVAVLRQRAPEASPDQIVAALVESGDPRRDPKSGIVTPRLDVLGALRRLRSPSKVVCRAPRTGVAGRRGPRAVRLPPRACR